MNNANSLCSVPANNKILVAEIGGQIPLLFNFIRFDIGRTAAINVPDGREAEADRTAGCA
jgi:hypothetical protein